MLLYLTLLSCHQAKVAESGLEGDTITMSYAENICMVRYDGYTKVILDNPWKKGSTLHTYYLISKGSSTPIPEGESEGATIIEVPLTHSAVY